MDDFIFGTAAVDELKLAYHRLAHSGLQHGHERSPRDPGAGDSVRLSVITTPATPVDQIVVYYTLDGSIPRGEQGRASSGHALPFARLQTQWDNLLWGYFTRWEAVIPGQPVGTVVRYRIGGWGEDGTEIFADWPDVKTSMDRMAEAHFKGQPFEFEVRGDASAGDTFTYHVDGIKPPHWARASVIYHIFVDRFYPGNGREWIQTTDLRAPFGGTLAGITEKLDYLQQLGADCLWLSPIFPSPTVHGYDAVDTERVEPRLGGDAALHDLVAEAHQRGIRIVLDLVCNHISSQHPIFVEALRDRSSPYRRWFQFDDSEIGYRTFFGVRTMPQLNLADEGARRWMIETGRRWLREFDVDGFRLDHANGPGPSFWADFWGACKEEKPECLCFGEMVEPADVIRRYTGCMDGALDFHFADAIRRTFARRTWSESELGHFLRDHVTYFDSDFLLLSFLDNHDMDRFLYLAQGDRTRLKQALRVQMRMPGPPVIYYGTEVGLSQQAGKSSAIGLEASRTEMIWGQAQDRELLATYQHLIEERKRNRPWDGVDISHLLW
ncbi:MAG: alpha-amylase family glycosyl hydrolase [Anaerolineales bacterium]